MSKTDLQNAPILLREDRAGGICVVTLNRPAQRNSLSRALLQALEDMLAEIAADSACRVVVLAGAGTVFCAGHDLREITAHRADADGGVEPPDLVEGRAPGVKAGVRRHMGEAQHPGRKRRRRIGAGQAVHIIGGNNGDPA